MRLFFCSLSSCFPCFLCPHRLLFSVLRFSASIAYFNLYGSSRAIWAHCSLHTLTLMLYFDVRAVDRGLMLLNNQVMDMLAVFECE
jgi:hypothetical protein